MASNRQTVSQVLNLLQKALPAVTIVASGRGGGLLICGRLLAWWGGCTVCQ